MRKIVFISKTLNSNKRCLKPVCPHIRGIRLTSLGTEATESWGFRQGVCPWRQKEDTPPSFHFPRESSGFCCPGNGCCSLLHLAGAQGSLRVGRWRRVIGLLSPQVPATSCTSAPARGWQRRQPCWSLGFSTQRGSSSACSFSIK